jgi:hypothetical protein
MFESFADGRVSQEHRWYFLATVEHIAHIVRVPEELKFEPSLFRTAVLHAQQSGSDVAFELQRLVDLHLRYAREWIRVIDQVSQEYPLLRQIFAELRISSGAEL